MKANPDGVTISFLLMWFLPVVSAGVAMVRRTEEDSPYREKAKPGRRII